MQYRVVQGSPEIRRDETGCGPPVRFIEKNERQVENKSIRPRVGFLFAKRISNSHVRDCSGESRGLARFPCGWAVGAWQLTSYSEVERLYFSRSRQHEVFRFDVAVQQSSLVCGGKCGGGLRRDPERNSSILQRSSESSSQAFRLRRTPSQRRLRRLLRSRVVDCCGCADYSSREAQTPPSFHSSLA